MSRYDEDLYENPFFMSLEQRFEKLFHEATANKWIICIPRFVLVKGESLIQKDYEDHILKPHTGDVFQTVSGCEVKIEKGQINLQKGFNTQKKVDILFEETFYNIKDESYRVLCISAFFNKNESLEASIKEDKLTKPPSNYEDCLNILWRNTATSKTKENFDRVLTGFCVQYQKLEEGTIEQLAELVSSQLTQAMQTVLKDQNIRRSVQHNEAFMTNLRIAVEMYMMNAVHKHLFSAVQLYTKSADAAINKKTRNLVDIRLHQLGVRAEFEENLPAAKKEIAMLNQYSTPMGRILCLKRVFGAITKPLKQNCDIVMTTDDILPLLIYLIIKSQIPNWSTNLMYMKHFQQVTLVDKDEISYYLATVEAALNYITSGELKIDSRQFSPQKVSKPTSNHDASIKRQISGGSTSTKEKFFQYVQYGDEAAVRLMLKKSDQSEEDVSSKLCHPLCDCPKCTEILRQSKQSSNKFSINARDDMGRIALHIATFYGQAKLIDILAKSGSLTDATDFMGYTPLHLACQKGHQNIILLLVHFGSDISTVDNEGNTPLHLCAKNGHEDCVKAILFLDILKNKLNVNAKNDMGDTPLHLAAKWGYEGIVRFLLESEANPLTRNRKRQTPLDVAQNPSIKQQLQTACDDPLPVMVPYPGFSDPPPSSPTQPTSIHSAHISNRRPSQSNTNVSTTQPSPPQAPQDYVVIDANGPIRSSVTLESTSSKSMMAPISTPVTNLDSVFLGQIEKLFKAIANKDLPLIKYYLGLSETDDSDEDDSPTTPQIKTLCHPLCQCSKCHPLQKVSGRTSLTINSQNRKGFAPLHIAVIEKNMDAFKLFIRRGANVNIQTIKHVTALHLACYCNSLEMTKTLVKCGAKVNAVDLHGEIPLHLACAKKNPDIVAFLIQSSSLVNEANVMGNTPLHVATSHNGAEVVRILLDNGAQTDIKNREGHSPYHLIRSPDVQKLLLKSQGRTKSASHTELSVNCPAVKTENISTTVQLEHSADSTKSTEAQLFDDIKSFDKSHSLKRSKTFDHSTSLLHSPELKLSLSIKSFDKSMCLKHSQTFDRSQSMLLNMKRNHAIQSFDSLTLRHVDLVDKSSPLHLYYMVQTSYKDYKDDVSFTSERGIENSAEESKENSEIQTNDDKGSNELQVSENSSPGDKKHVESNSKDCGTKSEETTDNRETVVELQTDTIGIEMYNDKDVVIESEHSDANTLPAKFAGNELGSECSVTNTVSSVTDFDENQDNKDNISDDCDIPHDTSVDLQSLNNDSKESKKIENENTGMNSENGVRITDIIDAGLSDTVSISNENTENSGQDGVDIVGDRDVGVNTKNFPAANCDIVNGFMQEDYVIVTSDGDNENCGADIKQPEIEKLDNNLVIEDSFNGID